MKLILNRVINQPKQTFGFGPRSLWLAYEDSPPQLLYREPVSCNNEKNTRKKILEHIFTTMITLCCNPRDRKNESETD